MTRPKHKILGGPLARLCLKKIQVIGFKSFADKTILEFEQGVTAIVGPNGCGKSNVSDAFRWVMGEQSAKSLRGDRMADILFSGTAKRKSAPYCEVSLTFDNREREFPVAADEVIVSRRLARKGDSEYRINGNGVRLKDLHHLFLDTGLGKDAFAIFEQGKIEEIIHRSSEERRPIFEQVSGICRYRHQWKEAQRKLAQTEDHLTRLSDIVSEVEKQIYLLERQVAEANVYKENKETLEVLERKVLTFKWALFKKRLTKAKKELSEIAEKQSHLQKVRDTLLSTKGDLKDKLAREEGRYKEALEALYALKASFQVHEAESEGLTLRFQEVEERAGHCVNELERIKKEQQITTSESTKLSQRRDKIREKVKFAENDLQKSQAVLSECQKALHRCQEEQIKLQKGQMEKVQKAHALSSRLKENEVRLEGLKERQEALTLEGQATQNLLKEQLSLIKERSWQSESFNAKLKQDHQKYEALKKEHILATSTSKELEEKIQALEKGLAKDCTEERILLELEEKGAGFSKGARLILETFKDQIIPLAHLIEPFPEEADKIASALQHYSHTLFATSDPLFDKVLEWASKEGISGFSITSPSLLEGAKQPKSSNLTSLCKVRLATPLLESLSTEASVCGCLRYDGSFIDHAGVLFTPLAQNESPLVRQAELKALKKAISKQEKERDKLFLEGEKWKKHKEEIDAKKATFEQSIRQGEMNLALLNASLERAKGDYENAKRKLDEGVSEKGTYQALKEKLGKEDAALTQELEKARYELTSCQEKADQIAKELEQQLSGVREFAKGRREREQRLHELSLERHQIESSASLIEAKGLNLQKEKHRLTLEREECVKKKEKIEQAIAALEKPVQEKDNLAQAEGEVAQLERALQKTQQAFEVVEKEEGDALFHLQALEKEGHALEVQMAKDQAGAEALSEEMLERFTLQIDCEPCELNTPLEEAEGQVRSLRKKVEGATAINLAATSEYDEKKQRYHFLSLQLDDLYKSKEELSEIIDELDRQSRTRFQATFEEVRTHFQEQFQTLFNGGSADLTFTGSEDILEAGIDIIAQPPGKKMRLLKLLSGGEKCLTAMALLFALFKVRPAPFCILDEMDAPLDDSNVERFINVVKPFMDKTQFLIITHNKQTMAAADTLFGVSMEEKGISKILSLTFEGKRAPLAVAS